MGLDNYLISWYSIKSNRANFALIRNIRNDKNHVSELKENVKFETDNIEQLLYHFKEKLSELPKCIHCNKDLEFKGLSVGYLLFCSKSCKTSNEHTNGCLKDTYKKRGITYKEKYGKGTIGYETVERKKHESSMSKYGVIHPMQNKNVIENYRQSSLKKYGETNPMKVKSVQDKVNQTNLNTYGYTRPIKNPEVFERMYTNYKKTIKEKYNVDCVFQIPEIFEKAQKSSFKLNYYKHLHYQANYEYDFIMWVESLGLLNKLSNGPYLWYLHKGKSKRYFSDFYFADINLIVEIKSTYWYLMYKEQNDAKRDECLNQEFAYALVLDKNYDYIAKLVMNIY